MKYQKTLNLWEEGVQDKIVSGEIKIQPGQWVFCGREDHKSIYVSHDKRGNFNVVHWQGTGARTRAHFMARIEVRRNEKLYQEDRDAWRKRQKENRNIFGKRIEGANSLLSPAYVDLHLDLGE